jgi:uncharacterized protein
MAPINLDILNKTDELESSFYRDVQLDFKDNDNLPIKGLYNEPMTTDIETSYDEAAIKNSLVNLFSTMPGQKLLNPDYGLNLGQFLFIPMSVTMARMIGTKILEGIEKYEPRITVENVNVYPDEEQSTYFIELTIKIPSLSNRNISFSGVLSQSGFGFN